MKKQSTHGQAGFTLIELIVVIVILGILAATALPRFADLGGDARIASVNAVRGSLSATSAMAHGIALVRTPTPNTVTMEGTVVNIVNLYPSAGTVAAGAGINVGGANDYVIANTATTVTISPVSASAAAQAAGTCSVVYTEAAVGGAPTIVASTGAC